MIVSQPGLSQRWAIGYELIPVIGRLLDIDATQTSDDADYQGLIYRHTHNQYLYRHPDGRIFDAWIIL